MNDLRKGLRALACMLLAIPSGLAYAGDRHDDDRHHGDRDFRIEVLSSKPYMVSGGDALVRVTVKDRDVSLRKVRIELNGANVTGAFVADASARTLTGLVTGPQGCRTKTQDRTTDCHCEGSHTAHVCFSVSESSESHHGLRTPQFRPDLR